MNMETSLDKEEIPNFQMYQNIQQISSLDGLSSLMANTNNVVPANNTQSTNFIALEDNHQLAGIFNTDELNNGQNDCKSKDVQPGGTSQFACNEIGCDKSYSTISGLNNHIKKYKN